MVRLKIPANDRTPEARTQLLHKFLANVLNHYGYRLDRILDINPSGTDIVMEGTHIHSAMPLYGEFKYYKTAVSALEVQAFYGKYMARWQRNKQYQGLLIALPGVDPAAQNFYQEQVCGHTEVLVSLYEEAEILKAILDTQNVVGPDTLARRIPREAGKTGDAILMYTEKGVYWMMFLLHPDQEIPHRAAVFDTAGNPVADRTTIRYLTECYPELQNFDMVPISGIFASQPGLFQDDEEIVLTRPADDIFGARLPTSAQNFIGRQAALAELESFADNVINKETSARSIVIEAPSGWGKSSLVLAAAARLGEKGHFVTAVDARSASSIHYVQRVLDHAICHMEDFNGRISQIKPAKADFSFEDAVDKVLEIGKILEHSGKLMFIFFDQFETMFSQPDILKRFKELYLSVCSAQTHLILGFSWKMEPSVPTEAFLDEVRATLLKSSRHIVLDIFDSDETGALLQRLQEELNEPLSKDMRFLISEFSQGYPWLLNRLCAHVLKLRQAGISQSNMVKSRLNFRVLFQEDLRSLSPAGQETLRCIAESAPIAAQHVRQTCRPELINELIQRGWVTRISNTYDIVQSDFRRFLVNNAVPVRKKYLLFSKVSDVFNATRNLQKAKGSMEAPALQRQTVLTEKSYRRLIRDMELLELAEEVSGQIILQLPLRADQKGFETAWRMHLRNKLQSNRVIREFLKVLEENHSLTLNRMSRRLQNLFPFIIATKRSWLTYARIFAQWMDAADLAILLKNNQILSYLDPRSQIRERHLVLPKRRGTRIPKIQFRPIESVAVRMVQALQKERSVDWTGFKKSTIFSALATLEDLGFIRRKTQLITILPKGRQFANHPESRPSLFADGALQLESFAKFIEILNLHKKKEKTLLELGLELRERLGAGWKPSTAETIAKIMLDWARNAKLAPGVFEKVRKGPIKGRRKKQDFQIPLF